METVNNTNDIIVSEKPNNIIVRKLIGTSECGKWNIFYNEDTGKKTYKPIDPDYFSK